MKGILGSGFRHECQIPRGSGGILLQYNTSCKILSKMNPGFYEGDLGEGLHCIGMTAEYLGGLGECPCGTRQIHVQLLLETVAATPILFLDPLTLYTFIKFYAFFPQNFSFILHE